MYCPLDDDALVMAVCRLSFMCDTGDLDAGRDELTAFFFDSSILRTGTGTCETACDPSNGILDYDLCIRGDNAANASCLADALELVMECLGFTSDRALRWIDSVRFRCSCSMVDDDDDE